MFISIFSDELGLDVKEALPIIRSWGLDYVDFRSRVFGKGIEALTAAELSELRRLCEQNSLKVGCLQTSLAKVHLPDEAGCRKEEAKLEGIVRAADALDCRLARVFHYWQPPKELEGALGVRPDEMQKVLDRFSPLAARAKAAGLKCAFENCGVTPAEVLAFLDALGINDWGVAWDVHNGWDCPERQNDEARFVRTMLDRSLCVHVKATGAVPGLEKHPQLPYGKILNLAHNLGFKGPVSAETHNPDPSVNHTEMSRRVVNAIKAAWPNAAPGAAVYDAGPAAATVHRPWEKNPVGFVVVGLGMGHARAQMIKETPGARLVGVCDLVEARAKRTADAFGVPYRLDVRDWLKNDEVEAVFVLTETGRHAEVALQAIEAGKHVMTTKPMEASLAACDEMIRAAERRKVILAVDFSFRFTPSVIALRNAVRQGRFGRLLGGTSSLKILRNMDYFRVNGGWHGTRRWDGGGVLSNQSIHHIDELAYVLGIPSQVRCSVWTQTHDIECEDLGTAVWKYDNDTVVTFTATTSYPHETWYNSLELFGTDGAYFAASGGPFKEPESKWFLGKTWTTTPPEEGKSEWLNNVDNLAAAIRTGAPLVCDGRDGRRTQAILDAMYRSAYDKDGGWTDVRPESG